ncbi:hypothetical protein [Nocardiopsis composta]|uniref:Uncharacterized protein n=1 Tax=Nocardiopsis composta TaxID=157465 RepID=A0A7W8VDT0_9ACTN|nr:hypothetical protein [Nocardiopsis composta]MBB5432385.1 hypothetical protein [Nocardiopsis composta]
MRAVLAVAAAAAVWVVGSIAVGMGVEAVAPVDQITGDLGRIAWYALPQLPLTFLMVLATALVYGRSRLRTALGAVVVLTPPAVDLVADLVLSVGAGTPGSVIAVRALCFVAGAAAAWWAVLPAAEQENVFARPRR